MLLLLLWGPGGEALLSIPSANIRNAGHYLRRGLTWPLRTKSELSLRAMPAGCIFGHKGPAVFIEGDDQASLLALLAIGTSKIFRALVELQLAAAEPTGRGGVARSYEVGVLQRTPVPNLSHESRDDLARCAREAWSLKRTLDMHLETSHAFTLPGIMQVPGPDIAGRSAAWTVRVAQTEARLQQIQAEIDARCFALYGIEEGDRQIITEGFGASLSEQGLDGVDNLEDEPGEDSNQQDEVKSTLDAVALAAGLVSWAVGVAFGRFDVRLATGTRLLPEVPEPFDSLPVCSPAMLAGEDGLPITSPPEEYPGAFPENGILVDDPGHARDLTRAIRTVFDEVFMAGADAWWNEVAALLDPKGHDLRLWLASSFFEHHFRRYSKSRRKAPIIWQLAVPSGRYSVWLYAHRITRDSFFQIQNDVVIPKIAHEERQLTSLRQSIGANPTAAERKEIAAQEALIEELRAMLAEVKAVAPLWCPTLDDGVVLTMAPLWRLVPHKAWQKELKSKWDELSAGKYDWSHIAMHLWPERVVPECRTDRSLAIAHGLENVFWLVDSTGKWAPRSTPLRSEDELIRERSSAAVKTALKSLLEANRSSAVGRRRSNSREGLTRV